jgi:uncharacterized protein YbjT (DUF2867 family)
MTGALRGDGHTVVEFVRAPESPSQRKFEITGSGLEIGDTSDIEIFIHCAWVLSGNAPEAASLNIRATTQLLDTLRRSNISVIFISSMAAFPGARSWYGKSKLEAESLILADGGIVVRPGTVFGGSNKGIVGAIDRVIRVFHVAPAFGGKRTALYLVGIDRLCKVMKKIVLSQSTWAGKTLSIFDPPKTSLAGLYRLLARNANTWVISIPVPVGPCIMMMRFCEWAGLSLPIRSDSLVSITNANPYEPSDTL